MTTDGRWLRRIEWAVALLAVAAIVTLHVVNLRHAGGLWRDEVVTYHVATMASLSELWHSVWYDSFPAGIHVVLRIWASLGGAATDFGLRAFGALIGLAVLGVVWLDGRLVGSRIPWLSMALVGFSPPVVRYGDSIRGYGFGAVTILLTFGLVWKVMQRPTRWRVALATAAAVLSVQTLYQNTALLAAICVSGVAVTVWNRQGKRAAILIAIWATAMVSLVPYIGLVRKAYEGKQVMEAGVTFGRLLSVLAETLGSPLGILLWMWLALFIAAVGVAVQVTAFRPGGPDAARNATAFSAIAMVTGAIAFMAFMKILDLPSQPWNYVPLVAFTAVTLQGAFAAVTTTPRRRGAMAVVAVGMMAVMAWPAWQGVRVRFTNVDLIAARLHQSAGPGDMILVFPWYCGATFQRYFHGPTAWTTLPPQRDLHVQSKARFKEYMLIAEPNRPVMQQIIGTLEAGHRVWLVGRLPFLQPGQRPPTIGPAPSPIWGWNHDAYALVWGMQVAHLIQTRALRQTVLPRLVDGPVHPYEHLDVMLVEGVQRGS